LDVVLKNKVYFLQFINLQNRRRKNGRLKYITHRNKETKSKRYLHCLVAEMMIKRNLSSLEIVHHVDGNGLNNEPGNLSVMTKKKHSQCHLSLSQCVGRLVKMGAVGFENGIYYAKER